MIYRFIILMVVLWSSNCVEAHSPMYSVMVLQETENKTWNLQVSTAYTAFHHEIQTSYPDLDFKTLKPEAFQKLVIQHLKENIEVAFNGKEAIDFGKIYLQIGHQTNVMLELLNVPKDLTAIQVKNTSFKNIHKNESSFRILKASGNSDAFVLNKENEHMAQIKVQEDKFELVGAKVGEDWIFTIGILTGLILLLVGSSYWILSNRKKQVLQPALSFG